MQPQKMPRAARADRVFYAEPQQARALSGLFQRLRHRARPLAFLMHAGFKAGVAMQRNSAPKSADRNRASVVPIPARKGLNLPDEKSHVSDNKNDKNAGAWARFISCVGSSS